MNSKIGIFKQTKAPAVTPGALAPFKIEFEAGQSISSAASCTLRQL